MKKEQLRKLIGAYYKELEAQQDKITKIKKLWATGCITQRQLAKIFGYSQSNISRIISEEETK